MENLNNVPSTGTFGNSVQKINSNFDLIVNAINSLEYQTTRSKGILNYGQNPATAFPNAVSGDWCMILSEGNVFPATIKTYDGSTWSGSGTWNPDGVDLTGYAKTTDMTTAIANSLAQATARMGYGECTVSGTALTVSIPNFILPTSGGTIHIKMSAAGTGASTLSINGTTAKTLWYNGAAVSAQNTWEADEIISVFYDGTKYMSSNSQGGGGDAEKIKYDNSQSGLASNNVQEALDEIREDNTIEEQITLPSSKTYGITNAGKWNMNSSLSHYQIPITPERKYKVVASASVYTRVWLCTGASTPVSKGSIPLCSGTSMTVIGAGKTVYIDAPTTANYMYVDGGSGSPQSISLCTDFGELNKEVGNIKDSVAAIGEEVFEQENIMSDAIDIPYQASQAVRTVAGHEGELTNRSGCGHSNYIPTKGAKKLYVLAPALGTSNAGIAFYYRQAQSSCCGAVGFAHYTGVQESLWKMYDVPEGANFFRMTLYTDTPSQYKIVTPSDYLMELFKQSCQSMIGTQIMRSAVPISDKKYLYAFGAPQYPIIGHKAYVSYGANENTVDGDKVGYPNVACMAIVDLFDLSHEVVYPVTGTKHKADGTSADNAIIGFTTSCATPQGSIASFGLMRFNDKNPYYCYSIMDVESISSLEPVDGKISPVKNWTTCRLSYNGNTVDFTVNNYRQMLVAMGYASSYIASTSDAVDNINLHYDKAENIYYAVLCGSVASSQKLPIVLMQSTDMATWSPKAYLGIQDTANEIEAIYKNGVAYVAYRTANSGMKYIVYNTSNNTILSSGIFPTSKEMLSKPDVFTFDNNVYMAINVDPSIYGELLYYNDYALDARQEIAIYKIINGVPKLFRKVNNPTGIDYFAFTEIPPMYATESSTTPMYAQGAIYVAFSEDRRHLYRRQIAQVSFADVTALFADFGRIV